MALSFSPSSWVIFVHFFVMQTVNKSLVTLSDLVVPRRGIPINCSHDSYTLQTHTLHTHTSVTHTPITHMHLHTLTHEKLNKVCGSRLNCNKSSEDRRRRRQKERERESARERWQERGEWERGSTFHIILTVCLGCVICTWHTLAASADRSHSATLSRRGGPTVPPLCLHCALCGERVC